MKIRELFPISTRYLQLLSLLCCLCVVTGCTKDEDDDSSSDADITIGALLDLSGPGRELGRLSKDAIDVAVEEARSQGVRISVRVADTFSDPAATEYYLDEFIRDDIRYVIGPQTSTEARSIVSIANNSGVLLVSNASTASSLSEEDDTLCRLVPTDTLEGRAIFDLMRNQGTNSFVFVGRNDTGNQSLITSVINNVKSARLPYRPTIKYATDEEDFTRVVDQMELAAAQGSDTAARVGIFIAGFDEVSSILEEAARSEYLSRSPLGYFGGDGSTLVDSIVDNGTAAEFASRSTYASPLLSVSEDPNSLAMAVTKAMGADRANAFALAAYDATILVKNIYLGNNRVLPLGPQLRDAFIAEAEGFNGASGTINLNANCDRASGSYDFWGICEVSDDFQWTKVATWRPVGVRGGQVSYLGCP